MVPGRRFTLTELFLAITLVIAAAAALAEAPARSGQDQGIRQAQRSEKG
jgi:uncharacterized protein YpmB